MNYYNDNDPFCCAWLRNLIEAGLIPKGYVDDRSITEIKPADLDGFTQCHFFCGIGGWPYALHLAGWGAARPVWTGSCPCQPLSVAGLGKGHEDERHLWPEFARLICECRPPAVFGEQVASADGRRWLAGVRLDLEAMGYAVGAADLCAAGVGAPHIRQRLFWVAQSASGRRGTRGTESKGQQRQSEPDKASPPVWAGHTKSNGYKWWVKTGSHEQEWDYGTSQRGTGIRFELERRGPRGRVGHTSKPRPQGHSAPGPRQGRDVGRAGEAVRLADLQQQGLEGHTGNVRRRDKPGRIEAVATGSVAEGCPHGRLADTEPQHDRAGESRARGWAELANGGPINFWSNSIFIPCADGKLRRVPGRVEYAKGRPQLSAGKSGAAGGQDAREDIGRGCDNGIDENGIHLEIEPALFPLADGIPNRVGILRGAGNAIVPQVAAEFIRAFMEASCKAK